MENRTCLTPIWTFDSTLPCDTLQYFDIIKSEGKIKDLSMASAGKLMNHGIISPHSPCKTRSLHLRVDTSTENEHSLSNYGTPIASASYCVELSSNIGCIGLIRVDKGLQGLGYGTQLKKIINNHTKQDGARVAFTYPCSMGGRRLCQKTGYKPVEGLLSDSNLWIREFSDP